MSGWVHVVHCVDTEGPLYESLEETFERLNRTLGLSLEPDREVLRRIQRGEMDLGDKTEAARCMVAPELLNYMHDWGMLDRMLDECLSPEFRQRHGDPAGNGWTYSWFVLDHVGFDVNPRRRDIGYHNVFDHYASRLRETGSTGDEMHWHFHPMSPAREAHICATSFLNSPHLLEGLARKVIDRSWFPAAFRAGCHAERPDSHWFLEQWVPFDFSNQSVPEGDLERAQSDISGGRFGDWRRAPQEWTGYHPAHGDYQRPGDCNRVIFRCLNVGTRLRLLTQEEVDRAFARAAAGEDAVLAFCNHDWRDMRGDIAHVHDMVRDAARRYPGASWRCSGAWDAARKVLGLNGQPPLDLQVDFEVSKGATRINVTASRDTFGPQPFLAIRTWDKRYFSDNFDVREPKRAWSYVLDELTIRPQAIEFLGVAACGTDGSRCVAVCGPDGKVISRRNLG
jgi:hypothetical protein